MIKHFQKAVLKCLIAGTAFTAGAEPAPLQSPDAGSIERIEIYSPQLKELMTIDVWLPDGYASSTEEYPVLYMHDGQGLFDPEVTWNSQSWNVDSVATALIDMGKIEAPIVVGIHSKPSTRLRDLMPTRAMAEAGLLDAVSDSLDGAPRGDEYLEFIAKTLMPRIAADYRVKTGPEHTFIMGSSMGGLMSFYALCEYPDLFGAAACLSTHWTGLDFENPDAEAPFPKAIRGYLDRHLPDAGSHRIYMDTGTETIDAFYGNSHAAALRLLERKGYQEGRKNLYQHVESGASHNEDSWSRRVNLPLVFLLGITSKK